jgi:hypothetical protein
MNGQEVLRTRRCGRNKSITCSQIFLERLRPSRNFELGFARARTNFTELEGGMKMDSYIIALWTLLGFALSTWVMIHFWLPDPPPNILGKYITVLVAGAIGGLIGGFLAHGRALSDPMPGIIGAAAGGLFLSGAVGFLTGAGRRSAG